MLLRIVKKMVTVTIVAIIVLMAVVKVCFSGEKDPVRTKTESLDRFLHLVFPECPGELRHTVLAAATDPEGYFRDHAAELEEKGYDEPYPFFYLSLLLPAMQEHNKLWTMDWKEPRGEINAIIRDLSEEEFVEILGEDDGDDEHALADELLPLAAGRMRPAGKSLLCLDTQSDSYTLLVVPCEKTEAIIAAAAACGITIEDMFQAGAVAH